MHKHGHYQATKPNERKLWSDESKVRTVRTAVEDGKGLREAAQLFNIPLRGPMEKQETETEMETKMENSCTYM